VPDRAPDVPRPPPEAVVGVPPLPSTFDGMQFQLVGTTCPLTSEPIAIGRLVVGVQSAIRSSFDLDVAGVVGTLSRRLESYGVPVVPPRVDVAADCSSGNCTWDAGVPRRSNSLGLYLGVTPCPDSASDLCEYVWEPSPNTILSPAVNVPRSGTTAVLTAATGPWAILYPARVDGSPVGDLASLADRVLDGALRAWGCAR